MSQGTIVLYDIDGTLIATGGAARHALESSIAEFLGRDSFKASFSFGGMTDPLILGHALREAGVAPTAEELDRLMARYLDRLDNVLEEAAVYRVHEGVHDSIAALSGKAHIALGLGTGNVERGARIKLARLDLNKHFAFGGYGDDSGVRAELIHAGMRRGAAQLGRPLDACKTIVIGDTVRDIDAGHANGALVLAVGTGGVGLDTLREAGADAVFETLAAPGAIETLVRWAGMGEQRAAR